MLSSSATIGVYAGAQVFWVIGIEGGFMSIPQRKDFKLIV